MASTLILCDIGDKYSKSYINKNIKWYKKWNAPVLLYEISTLLEYHISNQISGSVLTVLITSHFVFTTIQSCKTE